MNTNIYIGAAFLIFLIFVWSMWKWFWRARTKHTRKQHQQAQTVIRQRVGVADYKKYTEFYTVISHLLNYIPLGRLTADKRNEYSALILNADARHNGRLSIPEEYHVKQWICVGIMTVVLLFLSLISKFFLIAFVLLPYVFGFPISDLRESTSSGLDASMLQFRDFYNIYYAQYMRAKSNLRLQDVITSFKPLAEKEMRGMLDRVECDIAKGEDYALEQWDSRYPDSPKIHRFCVLAGMVSRGEGNVGEAIESFGQELEQEREMYAKQQLKADEDRVDLVCTIFTYAMLGIAVAIYFWLVIKGVRG